MRGKGLNGEREMHRFDFCLSRGGEEGGLGLCVVSTRLFRPLAMLVLKKKKWWVKMGEGRRPR